MINSFSLILINVQSGYFQSLVLICLSVETILCQRSINPMETDCQLFSVGTPFLFAWFWCGIILLEKRKTKQQSCHLRHRLWHVCSLACTRRVTLGDKECTGESNSTKIIQSFKGPARQSRHVLQSQGNVNSPVCWPLCLHVLAL